MYTKADFIKAIADTVDNYPTISALYKAKDPRILQNLEAQATMLAMLSSQLEVAMAEPFEKVRDATVLADAAMRGIVRRVKPGQVSITVTNGNVGAFQIASGRIILDSSGNYYIVDAPITIAGSSTGVITATQIKNEIISHTVKGSVPFYAIEVPSSDDGSFLSGLAVNIDGSDLEYRERYVNTGKDEPVFHVETDDKQRVYVRFGQENVVGYQPPEGERIYIAISRSIGVISPEFGSPFSFEYILKPQESLITFALSSVINKGESPPTMSVLRDLIKYPSVYDHNAVYLGEFDFLVRRSYPNAYFLSIWNENIEEAARGASVNNINTLFVACYSDNLVETFLSEPNPSAPVSPTVITTLTDMQAGIKDVIKAADDSYKVKFYTPVLSKIIINITATVSTAYTSADVQLQIRNVILAEFGIESAAAKRGSNKPLYQQVYSLLRQKIPALTDSNSDWQVSITPYTGAYRPELWRHVADDSLTVTVSEANISLAGWR